MVIHDTKRLDELYRQAKANMELEGFVFTEEDERDIKAVLSGKMTIEELAERLKQKTRYPEEKETLITPEKMVEDEKTEPYNL